MKIEKLTDVAHTVAVRVHSNAAQTTSDQTIFLLIWLNYRLRWIFRKTEVADESTRAENLFDIKLKQ